MTTRHIDSTSNGSMRLAAPNLTSQTDGGIDDHTIDRNALNLISITL